jgi:heat-inducible transcriptional repressor
MSFNANSNLPVKENKKTEREKRILIALVELYISTARPVGSQALKEYGFEELASATIRNYFASLEEQGLLEQSHSSSGRIPTGKGFEVYIRERCDLISETKLPLEIKHILKKLEKQSDLPLPNFLEHLVGILAQLTGSAGFTLVPQLEQDFVVNVRLLLLEPNRCLAVVITQFGFLKVENFLLDSSLDTKTLKNIETLVLHRLKRNSSKGLGKYNPTEIELSMTQWLYTEVLTRYLTSSSAQHEPLLLRSGLSNLLNFPEFATPASLVTVLSLLESRETVRTITNLTMHTESLTYWIGEKLFREFQVCGDAGLITIPYFVNKTPVGVIGILGPKRLNYDLVVPLMKALSALVSKILTRSIYKFKITHFGSSDTSYASKPAIRGSLPFQGDKGSQ